MIALNIKIFLVAFCIFLITDMIWLGLIAKSVYFAQYSEWLRLDEGKLQPIWWAVLIVYLLFALGIVVFITPLANGSLIYAGIYGALLGAVIYGIYDFTCLSLFKNWPVGMAFIDWIWGIFLCSWSSIVTVHLQSYLE
jgi:uncharacterized membrane protein